MSLYFTIALRKKEDGIFGIGFISTFIKGNR
jgi:hypothetical protein